MLEQGGRLGACFRRRLDEGGRARDKCDVLLWDEVQEAAKRRKEAEPSGSGKTQWKEDAKKAADLEKTREDRFAKAPEASNTLCTDLDEAMGTAFPDEWRTEQQQMVMAQCAHKLISEWQDGKRDGNGKPILGGKEGKQTEDGAQTRKKARLEDVEDSQLPCEDEEVTPLTEAAVNNMNEAIAKQDELMRAKRKNIAEQDEVLKKKRKGMAPESGKKEEQEVQGRNPQEPKNRNPIPPKKQICIAGRWIDKELAADEPSLDAYIKAIRSKAPYGEQEPNPRLQEQMNPMMIASEKAKAAVRAEEAQEMRKAKELVAEEARVNTYAEQNAARMNAAAQFAAQKKDQARGAAKQAQEMGKATEAKPLGPKAAETDKKAAETDKKAAEKRDERSKRQLRETRPTLQDLFTFLRISGASTVPGQADFRNDGERFSLLALARPPPSNLLSSVSWLDRYA